MTPVNKRIKREPGSTGRVKDLSTPTRQVTSTISTLVDHKGTPPPSFGVSSPFASRKEPGSIIQQLDPHHLKVPFTKSTTPPVLSANFDPKKYSYRPMYQKLSEVSEILDDEIDQYADLVLDSFKLQDEDIGNPSQTSQSETVVIGRIACDSLDGGRLNAASVMLETSRRLGTGSRTKLDLSALTSYALFPGQLVALKGMKSAVEFKVSEMLTPTPLPPSASRRHEFRREGTTVIVAAGPYTPQTDLSFDALKALRDVVNDTNPDSVILIGPFIDLTHPMIKSGNIGPSTSETLDGLFQERITPIIQDFPGLLLIPHINDAVSRHPCFPQEAFSRSTTGLPKPVKLLPNPALFSLDEVSYGVSSNDILKHLTLSEISLNPTEKNGLARQSHHLLQQRRFYPLFPPFSSPSQSSPSGPIPVPSVSFAAANLDVGYAGLTEFGTRVPDIILSPSDMTTFVKVVDGVMVINPGGLSKKAGAGTFVKIYIAPSTDDHVTQKQESENENENENDESLVLHKVWTRARVDVIKI